MRYLLTLISLLLFIHNVVAQGSTIHEYPWNPDYDNDNNVGVIDLTGFLSVFDSEFGMPPPPCTYDGSPLEEFVGGSFSGDIVVDSIFVELELVDQASFYVPGCPDPITDTIVFSNTAMLDNTTPNYFSGIDAYGQQFSITIIFDAQQGKYRWNLSQSSISSYVSDGFFGDWSWASTHLRSIPFPAGWFLDEDGIHLLSDWGFNNSDSWVNYANYLHILPYWHYAED